MKLFIAKKSLHHIAARLIRHETKPASQMSDPALQP
jgi:hypothetical protein